MSAVKLENTIITVGYVPNYISCWSISIINAGGTMKEVTHNEPSQSRQAQEPTSRVCSLFLFLSTELTIAILERPHAL